MGLGPPQQYLAQYNTYQLPGYVQNESFDSQMNIGNHQAPYADGSLSEYTGLENKVLNLRLKVWEADYLTCKNEIQKAATILRSKRGGFAPLYVQYTDRYYEAMVRSIRVEKTAGTSVRMLEYEATFECKPWLYSTAAYTISGTGTISTTGRTISDGGWTPTSITVTGTNVTISGYTATGDFAGYFSLSGAVSNLVIDSDAVTATQGGTNMNGIFYTKDYRTYVGPGVTYFVIAGASNCTITYQNRWYI